MTQHTTIHTGPGVKGHHRQMRAPYVLMLALPSLSSLAQTQSAPLMTAMQELTPLARMPVGVATGRSTAAAGVPALTDPARNASRVFTQACAEINRFTPISLDREAAPAQCLLTQKKNLVFAITLTNYVAHSAASQDFRLNPVPILQKSICNDGNVHILTRPGLSLVYRYCGNDRETVGDVPINESICGAL